MGIVIEIEGEKASQLLSFFNRAKVFFDANTLTSNHLISELSLKGDEVQLVSDWYDNFRDGTADVVFFNSMNSGGYYAFNTLKPGLTIDLPSNGLQMDHIEELFSKCLIMIGNHLSKARVCHPLLTQDIAIERDIPYYFLPNITLNWKTVMAPGYYEEFWDREVLLRAPAVAVRELENGWIELQTYRDLMDPLSEESLGQVRRLACYLEKYHRQAWDSILTAPELYEGGDRRPGCAGCGYE